MSLDLGKKFLSQKNFKDAEKIFLDLNKNNNNFEINYNLAIINFELKNIKNGELRIIPSSYGHYAGAGKSNDDLNFVNDAIKDILIT